MFTLLLLLGKQMRGDLEGWLRRAFFLLYKSKIRICLFSIELLCYRLHYTILKETQFNKRVQSN